MIEAERKPKPRGTASPRTIRGLPRPTTGSSQPKRKSRELEGTELLGRYAVERELGAGGMATVYRGRHLTIGRMVAIKVLHDEYAEQAEPVAHFLQEARAASRIQHENVVELIDFGTTTSGLVFLVMELLRGENLYRTIAREGALPWARVSAIMLQICGALAAAHAVGIVHRDLKPENCFRIRRGGDEDFIKVLDFGIAKVVEQDDHEPGLTAPRRTRIGMVAGTPEYMAPEQARGAEIDHRVDVYAAGAILFELATGRLPYIATSAAELLGMQLLAPVPDPRELVPALPPVVTRIVAKAMAKHPHERYATMEELAAAITDATSEGERRQRRHRVWWPAAGMLATLAIGAAWWIGSQSSSATAAVASTPVDDAPGIDAPAHEASVAEAVGREAPRDEAARGEAAQDEAAQGDAPSDQPPRGEAAPRTGSIPSSDGHGLPLVDGSDAIASVTPPKAQPPASTAVPVQRVSTGRSPPPPPRTIRRPRPSSAPDSAADDRDRDPPPAAEPSPTLDDVAIAPASEVKNPFASDANDDA